MSIHLKYDFFALLRSAVLVCFAIFLLFSSNALAQVIAVDGGTSTTVSVGGRGVITVGIAPADTASISHNTYSSFSVPNTGVDLDNSAAGAGIIVNEVTSTNISNIQGPLTVVGQKADVVIANPNGITVNGGRFQNTGNVALTTGKLGRNVNGRLTARVTDGGVLVGVRGLSGTMQELAIISKWLRIEGPLRYDTPTKQSHVNFIIGDSAVNFDANRGGAGPKGSGILPWAMATSGGSGTVESVIVDISRNGSLSAGRISMTVTDAGAGVRFAGDQLATAGGFNLTSSGRLELSRSKIAAKGSVNINAASVSLKSQDNERASIVSGTSGVTVLASKGNIDLGFGKISGRVVSSDNLDSAGGVTLVASGDISSRDSEGKGAEITSDAGKLPNTLNNSNIVFNAEGVLRFSGLKARATNNIDALANGTVAFASSKSQAGGNIRVASLKSVSFDDTDFKADKSIEVTGAALRFGADDLEQARTQLVAQNGGVTLRAVSGDVLNYGSLLQGSVVTADNPLSKGGLSIYAAGDIVNRSLSVGRLAVAFGKVDDLYIKASGNLRNETGRLFSNAGITLKIDGDILSKTAFTKNKKNFSVWRERGRRMASSLFLKRSKRTHVSADFGEQQIAGEQSFILGIGNVSMTANNIRNIGGDISGADVAINTTGEFYNEAHRAGRLRFTQRCKWFCKTSGSSTLRLVGGTVTASKDLKIDADKRVYNLAGTITGKTGVEISSPATVVKALYAPTLIERPTGIGAALRGKAGYLASSYSFGTIRSLKGDLTIKGDVNTRGAALLAGGDVRISGTKIESVLPTLPAIFERRPIGLFWNIFR